MRWGAVAWIAAIAALVGGSLPADEKPATEETANEKPASAELQKLYQDDQADRSFETPPTPDQWKEIVARDKARRERVMDLIRSGALESADDYFNAAMVLQHAEGPDDVLVAHILATVAGFKGHEGGRWLSAAALDRFLHRVERPQMLGTQFVREGMDQPWTQGKYDPWLPDSIRNEYGVRPLEMQKARVEKMNEVPPKDSGK